ncbi:MAG: DMT family transporter, partial [Lachnospiraceae bacterium]|nr:DMT family transporter [Lachnospiraceae bacterium]
YLLITGDFKNLTLNANTVILLLIVCIIHTGLAYALYFGSMTALKAQTISLFSYIDPIVAMVVSAVILKEGITWEGIIGAVLIIGSAIVSEYERK